MYDYFQLVGNNVEVMADGMVYHGRLIEIGETDLHLETEGGWLTIPIERVSSVELAEEG